MENGYKNIKYRVFGVGKSKSIIHLLISSQEKSFTLDKKNSRKSAWSPQWFWTEISSGLQMVWSIYHWIALVM